MTILTKLNHCPHCGKELDAATSVIQGVEAVPNEDDLTICLGCAAVLFFNADGTVRAPRPGEVEAVKREEPEAWQDVLIAQRRLRLFNQQNPRK